MDPKADVVVAGDLNDFQFSPALKALTAGGVLTDLVDRLPRGERYGYVYQATRRCWTTCSPAATCVAWTTTSSTSTRSTRTSRAITTRRCCA